LAKERCEKGNLGRINQFEIVTGRLAVAINLLYGSKLRPELYTTRHIDTESAQLAGLLATSLFRYRVPYLSALSPDQIFEARDRLKEFKEGFTDLVFSATDDVLTRLKAGEQSEAIAADKTVTRKLKPLLDELARQLGEKENGFWANVLAAGGK